MSNPAGVLPQLTKRVSVLELRLQSQRKNYRLVMLLLGIATAIVAFVHIPSIEPVHQTVGYIELAAAICICLLAAISREWTADRLGNAGAAALFIAASVANISTVLREPTLMVGSDSYGPQSVLICMLFFCSGGVRTQFIWASAILVSVLGLDFVMRGQNGVRYESVILLGATGVVSLFAGHLVIDLLGRGQESIEHLFVEARTDLLTGMPNRKYFEEAFLRQQQGARRQGLWFSVCLIDVDHFKSVNDRFGHGAGDEILIEIARVFSRIIREWDLIARWGGEEFILLLNENDPRAAVTAADRIRKAVENHLFTHSNNQKLNITISIGLVLHDGIQDLSSVVERADKALMLSKKLGRNCISVYQDEADKTDWSDF
jgi:diguanylate cyclase (GGDEF)-like protein